MIVDTERNKIYKNFFVDFIELMVSQEVTMGKWFFSSSSYLSCKVMHSQL